MSAEAGDPAIRLQNGRELLAFQLLSGPHVLNMKERFAVDWSELFLPRKNLA